MKEAAAPIMNITLSTVLILIYIAHEFLTC